MSSLHALGLGALHIKLCLLAHSQEHIKIHFGNHGTHFLVQSVSLGAEFQHIAQNGNAAVHLHVTDGLQSHLGRRRVCIVAVRHNLEAVGILDFHAHVGRMEVGKSLGDIGLGHSVLQANGDSSESVIEIMNARHVQRELGAFHKEGCAVVFVPFELFGLDNAALHAKGHHLIAGIAAALAKARVIGVHNEHAVLLEACDNRSLFGEYAVQILEAFQVRSADVGNHGHIGLDCERKRTDFIRAACAHFDNCRFVAVLQLEQRHGHTDVVIEVACGGVGVILLRKNGLHHFLGGGLAVAARNGNLLHLEILLIALGELEERFRRIVDGRIHLEVFNAFGISVHDTHQCSIFFHLCNKLVGVKSGTLDRPKDHTLGGFARIHAKIHLTVLGTAINPYRVGFEDFQEFLDFQVQLIHFPLPSPLLRGHQNGVWSYPQSGSLRGPCPQSRASRHP